ncbi:MAG: acyl carrier protein [Terrimicrobiaceae bacterium]
MQESDFIKKFAEFLSEDSSKIQAETPLGNIGNWDSMGKVSFLSFLDEEFQFQPKPGDLDKCQTVADVIGLLKDRISK